MPDSPSSSASFPEALAAHTQSPPNTSPKESATGVSSGTSPASTEISVIIPNFNGVGLFKRYLAHNLFQMSRAGITDIIIVDDASTDDSVAMLHEHFPMVRVVENLVNKGFGESCNAGAALAKHDRLLFLNNDMTWINWDQERVDAFFQNPNAFALAPRILREQKASQLGVQHDADTKLNPESNTDSNHSAGLNPDSACDLNPVSSADEDNRINESITTGYFRGGWFSTENVMAIHSGSERAYVPKDGEPILWACGGAMIVSKSKFNALGGFDPLYSPFYVEDLDLSYSAWKRGWRVEYTDLITFHHCHQGTIGVYYTPREVDQIHLRNQYLFMWKHLTDWEYRLGHFITTVIKCLSFQVQDSRAIYQALWRIPYLSAAKKRYHFTTTDKAVLATFRQTANWVMHKGSASPANSRFAKRRPPKWVARFRSRLLKRQSETDE